MRERLVSAVFIIIVVVCEIIDVVSKKIVDHFSKND